MDVKIEQSWKTRLQNEFEKEYFINLTNFSYKKPLQCSYQVFFLYFIQITLLFSYEKELKLIILPIFGVLSNVN